MGMEVELKLALAPEASRRLQRHPLLKGCKPIRRKLLSIYFDTVDFALARRGVALRLRRSGYHWEQTLKAGAETVGALTARPEWNIQVTGNQPDLDILPAEARGLLAGIGAADLRPCFSTEFTRIAWHIEGADGALELALDQGEVRAGEAAEAISEVEFELKAGSGAQLFQLAGGFLEALPFTLEPRSKAERGYLLAGAIHAEPVRAARTRLHADQDAGLAWRSLVAAALSHLIANVPGTLAGADPEYLHQMRVAVRRLRTLLKLARSLALDESLWADDLRWLMGELSPARDWDVLVTETWPKLTRPWAGDAGVLALRQQVDDRRAEANRRARTALTSGRFVRLVLAAEEAMVEAPNVGRPVAAWASEILDHRLKQLKKKGRNFAKLDAAGRHALRIAAKRLRYSAEAFASLHGKRAARYLAVLASLQDELGASNDLVVAQRLLDEFDNTPQAYVAGRLTGYLAGAASSPGAGLKSRYRRLLALKPFWR